MPDITTRAAVATTVRDTVAGVAWRASAAQAPALSGLAESQLALARQVDALDAEMARVAAVVDGLSLDPATSRHMVSARDSLQRSRTRLVTVRGRLGRLRGFEESQRLVPVQPAHTEMRALHTPAADRVSSAEKMLQELEDDARSADADAPADPHDPPADHGPAARPA